MIFLFLQSDSFELTLFMKKFSETHHKFKKMRQETPGVTRVVITHYKLNSKY